MYTIHYSIICSHLCLDYFNSHNIFVVHSCSGMYCQFILFVCLFIAEWSSLVWICHVCLSTQQLLDSWIVSPLGLLQTLLLWTFTYTSFWGHMFSFLLGKYLKRLMFWIEHGRWKGFYWMAMMDTGARNPTVNKIQHKLSPNLAIFGGDRH